MLSVPKDAINLSKGFNFLKIVNSTDFFVKVFTKKDKILIDKNSTELAMEKHSEIN